MKIKILPYLDAITVWELLLLLVPIIIHHNLDDQICAIDHS